ncbi:MAG: hypothetical protein IKP32_02750 [Clostridia bacterium]|nr:hypothetical protein [Clostridia bacterium]
MLRRYSLPDPRFLPLGRHDPREKESCLWWSGSGVRVHIACRQMEIEATVNARDHAAWMGVMVDGAPVARFPLINGTHRYPVLAGMESTVSHDITILRDSQLTYDEDGPVVLNAVYTDGEPAAPALRPLLLEFVGDSLTVGEGCVGPRSGDEWRTVFISHMPAFPTLVAEEMNAEKRVIALGGWGASQGWDLNPDSRIGRIYGQLCGPTPGGNVPADFPERPADAVVINLGTNDATAMSSLEGEKKTEAEAYLTECAENLLCQVRARNPHAHIVWAYGLCGWQVKDQLEKAVAKRRADGDGRVHYLALTDCDGDVGSRWHPSRAAHRRAAREICDELKKLLT